MHAPLSLPLLRRLVRWLAYAGCQAALLIAFGLRALARGRFPFSFGGHTASQTPILPPRGRNLSPASPAHHRTAAY
ncbi:hypothetical protein ACW9KT_08895 [Hymenobacter sp. HD11105]